MNNRWFQGEAIILTNSIEELLATKLRALYQRKKGRDLYDFWYAMRQLNELDIEKIIDIFYHYMETENAQVSRAEFEKNLSLKRNSPVFNNDIKPLLTREQLSQYEINDAYELLFREFFPKLSGEPWKGLQTD